MVDKGGNIYLNIHLRAEEDFMFVKCEGRLRVFNLDECFFCDPVLRRRFKASKF